MNEVVITACGVVSPIGLDVDAFRENLFLGKSGVRAIRGTLVPDNFPVPYAAWIPPQELPSSRLFGDADVPKSWRMTELATRQALRSLRSQEGGGAYPKIDAVVYGTADGVNYGTVEGVLKNGGFRASHPFAADYSESSLNVLRDTLIDEGFAGVPDEALLSLNSACATGNQTLGIAFQGIRAGRWERCLVGGVDARCEASNFLNFFLLGAVTTDEVPPEKASRPFSKNRSGFVRGEGAAVLVVESLAAARARGAKILAKISGYACTSDAFRLTDGRDDGSCVAEAMRRSLRDAGLEPGDIDSINAHGTSTPLNDRLETMSIKKVFGPEAYHIPISSLKSQIGHSTIASSSIEAIACLLMLQEQKVSPTLNYDEPDPECDLDYVPNVSRPLAMKHILSNSFGFGGQNTCLVISKGV